MGLRKSHCCLGGRACSTAAPVRQPSRAQSRRGRPASHAARNPLANKSPAPGNSRAPGVASAASVLCLQAPSLQNPQIKQNVTIMSLNAKLGG